MIALFTFYNSCDRKIQNLFTFSKNIKHSSLIMYDGKQCYFTEMIATGIKVKVFPVDDILDIIQRLQRMPTVQAIVSTFIHKRAIFKWYPLSINSCNELDRKVSGIDIGLTLNPKHLYNKLLKLDGLTNYTIDRILRKENEWRR